MNNRTTFIRTSESSTSLRVDFIIALIPAVIWSFVRFGFSAFITMLSALITSCLADILIVFFLKSKIKAPSLYSVYCGIVFGATLYKDTHLLLTVSGAFLCILLIHMMGGAGKSFLFAPIVARFIIFNLLPFRVNRPVNIPIEVLYNGELPQETVYDFVLGMSDNSIGTVSAIAVILAIAYLWIRKSADFKTSFVYIGCLLLLSFAFPAFQGRGAESALFELLASEALFAAAFILPDYGSSPNSTLLKYVSGILCALITFIFRKIGYTVDSVFLAVMCTNMIVYFSTTFFNHIKEVKYEKQIS